MFINKEKFRVGKSVYEEYYCWERKGCSFWIPYHQIISEASIIKYLSKNLFRFMVEQDRLSITKTIFNRQISVKARGF